MIWPPRLYGGVRGPIDWPSPCNIRRLDALTVPMLCEMEQWGIAADRGRFLELDAQLAGQQEAVARKIQRKALADGFHPAAGGPINPAAPGQVGAYLKHLGLALPDGSLPLTPTGQYATGDEVLAMLNDQSSVVPLIREYRGLAKLRDTYTQPLAGAIDHDGRIRTVFNDTVAETGRLSSGDRSRGKRNLQNIPPEIRGCFVAPPGRVLVSCDLSQIEMVWAAHLSQDRLLMRVFLDGLDVHTMTACAVFGFDYAGIQGKLQGAEHPGADPELVKWAKGWKKQYRLPSKTLGFAILYGVTADGLQTQIAAANGPWFEVAECQALIDKWYGAYYGVREWMDRQHYRARRYGMVWDAFGRVRWIPEVRSRLQRVVQAGLRQAGNMPVQGSAQGVIKLVMGAVMPTVYRFRAKYGERAVLPLLQIHDELVFEVAEGISGEFAALVRGHMEGAVNLSVPVKSSSDIGKDWGELK